MRDSSEEVSRLEREKKDLQEQRQKASVLVLLMVQKSGDHHLGCIKLCKSWDKLPTSSGDRRISFIINNMLPLQPVSCNPFAVGDQNLSAFQFTIDDSCLFLP